MQVFVRDVAAPALDEGDDLLALLGRGQPEVGVEALGDGRVAPNPAEHKVDRRQQRGRVEAVDDIETAGHVRAPWPLTTGPGAAARAVAPAALLTPVVRGPRRSPVVARYPHEFGIDVNLSPCALSVVREQVEHPSAHHHVL